MRQGFLVYGTQNWDNFGSSKDMDRAIVITITMRLVLGQPGVTFQQGRGKLIAIIIPNDK